MWNFEDAYLYAQEIFRVTFKTDVGIVGEVNNGWIFQPTLKKEKKEGLADYLNDDLLFIGKIGVCHWLRMNCVADLKMMGEAVRVDLDTNENKPLYLRMTSDEEMRHYRRLTELIGEEKVNKLKNAIRERIIWERDKKMKNFEQGKKEIPDIILFPSSYLNSRQVDEALQAEYDAVKKTGLFDVWLFSYDKWFNEGKLVLDYPVTYLRSAIYRGWMMKPAQYKDFYDCLLENNIKLITSPEQYENLHIFPNAYKYISDDTARIITYPLHEEIDINTVKEQFSRFMVKDYVKSVKGSNFPKYFDHTITQEEFNHWMEVFYKYRSNLLTGGICIKEYIDLKRYGDKTNEYRVFYVNNEVATISRNSSQGSNAPLPPQEIVDKYKNLKSDYYTVDYAELTDGTWKIIEVGDGSVSGLSDNQDYVQYFEELHRCLLINILND